MKIELLEVAGIFPALHGMRNAYNSHDKQDTFVNEIGEIEIGQNDMELAQRLIIAGGEHRKFLRQIVVWADFRLPRYVWSEFDTYHFNTKNSESTMHRLFNKNKEVSMDSFYTEGMEEDELKELNRDIKYLNRVREGWLKDFKFYHVRKAKRKLSETFLQTRTVCTSYEELRNIYFQRRHHRLKDEWGLICQWIESLPYAKELIILERE
jgi:hypothetical protein